MHGSGAYFAEVVNYSALAVPPARRASLLACGVALLMAASSAVDAQMPAPNTVAQAVEPSSPRVGKVRRNAQGVIELAPEAAPAPPAAPDPTPQPAESVPTAPAVKRLPAAPSTLPGPIGGDARAQKQPTEAPAQPVASASMAPACDATVLLCLRVIATTGDEQRQVPVTFGHPLAAGLLPSGQSVVARYGDAVLPVQIDQVARHNDGSVRFAVFSLSLPRLGGRETAKVELSRTDAAPTVRPPPIAPAAADLKVELETYAPPVWELTFGNRSGATPGIPFKRGETITLAIGADPVETYSLTITPEMESGLHPAYTAIAAAFVPIISKSAVYRAHRDSPEVYETLWITSRERPGKAFSIRINYGGAAKIAAKEVQKWMPRQRYVASLPAGAGIGGSAWLDGPVVRDGYVPLALRGEAGGREHPALNVLLGVRRYAGSDATRFDVTVDNTSVFVDEMKNYNYDTTVRTGDTVLFEKKNIEHYAAARWHKLVWTGRAPQIEVIHDRARLLGSRALPAYDANLKIADAAIAEQTAALRRADTGPMGAAFIYPRMPTTGGRPDIGPLPRWAALHALSLDPRQAHVVLANGDASGSVPIHFRDQRSGIPINTKQFPAGRLYNGVLNLGDRTVRFGWVLSPFIPDTSHEPSLAYYPYLLTGERFYLDELHYWASFNAFVMAPDGRGGAQGLLQEDQVRGQAWSLRTLGHAALVTPVQHPLKATFQEQLKANMDWYVKRYTAGAPAARGTVLHLIADPYHADDFAPWQQDFMAIVVANLAENGVEGADRLLRWMSGYILGRWLAEDKGYCRANGVGYWLKFIDPQTRAPATSWMDLHRANWPNQKSCAGAPWSDEYVDCANCYTTIARAALASLANLGYPEALEPYDFIRSRTGNARADLAKSPTFALAPRR